MKDHVSRIKDQAARLKHQGSRMRAQGSRTKVKDQGPCPGTDEHPGRSVDVTLGQIKARIELFILDRFHGRIHAPHNRV